MKKLMQHIKEIIFGVRAQGEKLPEPKPMKERSFDVKKFQDWVKEVKFGSRYGHRGSFYQKN